MYYTYIKNIHIKSYSCGHNFANFYRMAERIFNVRMILFFSRPKYNFSNRSFAADYLSRVFIISFVALRRRRWNGGISITKARVISGRVEVNGYPLHLLHRFAARKGNETVDEQDCTATVPEKLIFRPRTWRVYAIVILAEESRRINVNLYSRYDSVHNSTQRIRILRIRVIVIFDGEKFLVKSFVLCNLHHLH